MIGIYLNVTQLLIQIACGAGSMRCLH
ncbi:hypothetical protein CBM2586_A50447 [Cupriavidus phytorum]|uniref:Uncharacterized protein n=1 Tax=Cupriavidus taiwanensis TaxID=164546 RepID=A0A976A5C0_9BURK|nr:hypothetical protein CBM2586_A50447 [Cupriavidus taiwanensis]